ncbi:Protein of unknown function [Nocardiopsis flavescens]|uniref:DUF4231 domain-containing protein n=1 Tax=Nocardiopsis flavescens TaxID=758803 RepID=A0A1M6HP33_9ACTN|nr:SLATT domain-containing protein [Nocardiopsis flavescens]SHJ23894.1 Protein of unknown function [Nocardiopsis flavescens]
MAAARGATEVNDQLLLLNHQIRQTELSLQEARRRRVSSNISLFLGPFSLVILYVLWWTPLVPEELRLPIYVPSTLVALVFGVYSLYLKKNPGGIPRVLDGSDRNLRSIQENSADIPWLERIFKRDSRRPSEGDLELELARLRDTRKLVVAREDISTKVRRVTYKEDAYADIDQLRNESRSNRRINNILQSVIIMGSLLATGVSGLTVEWEYLRWIAMATTFLVGISSGFMGYFKYKERSFYLQQTADAIESEWEAVEIGVGRYKKLADEDERLADFVEEVHRLKSEQKKRQQNLEQPPESRNAAE